MRYLEVKGRKYTWYVPNTCNYDHLLMCDENNKNGYYGSHLTISLLDGSAKSLEGPWNSNELSLIHDTGLSMQEHIDKSDRS